VDFGVVSDLEKFSGTIVLGLVGNIVRRCRDAMESW